MAKTKRKPNVYTLYEQRAYTFYEQMVLNHINLEDEGGCLEYANTFEKVCHVMKCFHSEKRQWRPRSEPVVKSLESWLQGLPSVCSLPCYNSEWLEAYEHHFGKEVSDEEYSDFINNVYLRCAEALITLRENL